MFASKSGLSPPLPPINPFPPLGPLYQGNGLGRYLMTYVLDVLADIGTDRVSLFADPGVVSFYQRQGWDLEPQGHRCAFWYAS